MLLGLLIATSLLVLLVKTGIFRRLLPYHPIIDILVSLYLVYSFGGTVTGLTAAIGAGLILSVVLSVANRTIATERPVKRRHPVTGKTYVNWERRPPNGLFN